MPESYQIINVPGVGRVRFPTSMSDDDVTKAVAKLHTEATTVAQPSLAAAMTGPHSASDSYQGPTDFWGGFRKSLKDQVLGATVDNPALQGAAHPQTTSDFLSLIVPGTAQETLPGLGRSGKAAMEGAAEAKPGILNRIKGAIQGLRDRARVIDTPEQDLVSRGFNDQPLYKQMERLPTDTPAPVGRVSTPPASTAGFNDLPLAQQMEHLPTSGPSPVGKGSPLPPTQENFNDLPLHRQMEHLPETAAPPMRGSEPPISNLGKETATPPAPIRLAGTKAQTLEDALLEAVQGAREGEKPMLSTAAPEASTVGEGATKQSGKFGKADSKGQAGGYSSGRPSTQPSIEDSRVPGDVPLADASKFSPDEWSTLNDFMGHGVSSAEEDAIRQSLQDELGGGSPVESAEPLTSSVDETEAATPHTTADLGTPRVTGLKPESMTDSDWVSARKQYGSRKLAALTGKSVKEVKDITEKLAPGQFKEPPLEAQGRIADYEFQQHLARDN